MRRGRLAAWMLVATVLTVGMMLMGSGRKDVVFPARLVTVTAGNVRRIAALSGRLTFNGEHAACAALPGQVAEVYVTPGERVAAGQALVRLEAGATQRVAAAWASGTGTLAEEDVQALVEGAIIRAPENATVRQVLTQEYAMLTAGEPVVILSDSGQEILCVAAERDAREVQPGMRATLLLDGEEVGQADVTQVGPVEADETTGRLLCPVTLVPRQRLSLPMGAALEVDVVLLERSDVPILPLEAVTERSTLWWVHDGICTEIPAEIVLSDEMNAWVNLPEGITIALGEFTEGQHIREVTE